jgi:uncharacterized protein involved in exopolysaccharide biosynthesis
VVVAAAKAEAQEAARKPAVRRQERGSLFSRRLFGGPDPELEPTASTTPTLSSDQCQQLEALSGQLEEVTSCMKVEMQARVAAEKQLEETRGQVQGLLQHLHEMETTRREEASTLVALRGLLAQIQSENASLKEQNASLSGQCRSLMAGQAKPPRK